MARYDSIAIIIVLKASYATKKKRRSFLVYGCAHANQPDVLDACFFLCSAVITMQTL